jgi:hypothetical protein
MTRDRRRWSRIACSCWIGGALQSEYTMGQPLKCLFRNDLQKCPVENKEHKTWVEAEVRGIARSGFIADDKVAHDGGNTWLLLRFKMTF